MSVKLLKSTFITGVMTLLSRITGLIRDVFFANFLASGVFADAFFVAFRIPNFFRRIFAEGAFSAAFVPVFSEVKERRSIEQIHLFLAVMSGRLALILLVLTVIVVWAAPWVVMGIAPGFIEDRQKFELTTSALRIVFPYLFFISMVAMSAGILNTVGRFATPAFTPVLLNLSLIAAVLWFIPWFDNATEALAWGVMLAGALQLLFQLPFLRKENLLVAPKVRATKDQDQAASDSSWQVFKLMLPAIFGVSIAQINLLVNTILASFLVTGSVSWLYYSDRLMEFPVGVFGIALATVILPNLSNKYNDERRDDRNAAFSDTLDWALRWVFLISVPASVGLIVLAEPLVATIFYHGAFSPTDVAMVSRALIAFSIGLLAIIAVKVLAPGFYARQDTTTPVRIGVVAMLVNIVVSIALVFSLKHVGLALATSVAAVVNALLLYLQLRKEQVFEPTAGWPIYVCKVCAATLIMGIMLYWCAGTVEQWLNRTVWERAGWLGVLILGGMAVYVLGILLAGIRPWQLMIKPGSE